MIDIHTHVLPGIDDGAAPHRSVEEMARDYLTEVKQVQPRGPYFFGGECIGGVIAFEMGRQALAGGDDVGLVVLLDSRPPRYASYLRHWLRYLSSRARIRLQASNRSPSERPLWRTARRSPNRSRKRLTTGAARPISGTRTMARPPASTAAPTAST